MLQTNKHRQTFTKEVYADEGRFRFKIYLRMGNAYSCTIFPEQLEAINRGEDFIDDGGFTWKTTIRNGIVTLQHASCIFTIALAELNA